MAKSISILILCLLSSVAHANIEPADAVASVRDRMNREWKTLVDADKAFGWRVDYRGKTYRGDWVVSFGGWRYFFERGTVRCRLQTDEYMSCNKDAFVKPVWSTSDARPAATLEHLRTMHRAIWGNDISIWFDRTGSGHATVETIVSTPDAESRTSRRYRAHVVFITTSFAVATEPELVEEYRETCFPINGCHSTHWTCRRVE